MPRINADEARLLELELALDQAETDEERARIAEDIHRLAYRMAQKGGSRGRKFDPQE